LEQLALGGSFRCRVTVDCGPRFEV